MRQKNSGYKNRRAILVIVLILMLVITAFAIIYLWNAHINRLRAEMDSNLTSVVENIEQGAYANALTYADEALVLAQRLRDDEAVDRIAEYILLAKTVIRGNELFDAGDFQTALGWYQLAAAYASKINDLNADSDDLELLDTRLIDEKIALTEIYIAFYSLIEQAENYAGVSDYEAALATYEESLVVASALSYTMGIDLAESGIEEMHKRIIEAKRTEAMNLFVQGENLYKDRQYAQALEYFYDALEIYLELNDQTSITLLNARISYAERMLAESEHQESPAADDTPDDTPHDEQDGTDIRFGPSPNYEHNLSISFDMFSLIDNQNQRPANQVRMGSREGMNEGWYNGCGWVATYNALILLGTPEHPAEIVRYFETSGGTVFGGVFGTYPNSIESYIRSLGYSVNHAMFPQLSMNIDNTIKASRVSILAYVHTSAAHYATIEYREDIGKFVVYNDRFARTRSESLGFQYDTNVGAAIDSVAAFINNTPDILFSFSLITVG